LVGEFVQVPACAVSFWPTVVVPVIVGSAVLTGSPLTTPVAELCCGLLLPAAFTAMTDARTVWRSSAAASLYVAVVVVTVADVIVVQLEPPESQRSHETVYFVAAGDQVPRCAVSV
jgi:hypothetical protein